MRRVLWTKISITYYCDWNLSTQHLLVWMPPVFRLKVINSACTIHEFQSFSPNILDSQALPKISCYHIRNIKYGFFLQLKNTESPRISLSIYRQCHRTPVYLYTRIISCVRTTGCVLHKLNKIVDLTDKWVFRTGVKISK